MRISAWAYRWSIGGHLSLIEDIYIITKETIEHLKFPKNSITTIYLGTDKVHDGNLKLDIANAMIKETLKNET